ALTWRAYRELVCQHVNDAVRVSPDGAARAAEPLFHVEGVVARRSHLLLSPRITAIGRRRYEQRLRRGVSRAVARRCRCSSGGYGRKRREATILAAQRSFQ